MAVDELREMPGIFHQTRAEPEKCVLCEGTPVVHRLRVRLDEFDVPRPDIRTLKARIHTGTRTDGIAEYWLCDDCGHKNFTFEIRHNEDGDGLSVLHLVSSD